MKTGELIAELQRLDPSGEIEVVAGATPIYFAEHYPAYYDGPLQMLQQDKSRSDYNITGYAVTQRGEKIVLHLMSLEDVLVDNPDAPLDLNELGEYHQKRWQERADKLREESRALRQNLEEATP